MGRTMMAAQAPCSRPANGTLMARGASEWPTIATSLHRCVPLSWDFVVERVTRIELALSAWEADVLPLNYTREGLPSAPPSP
jgi:hypothetical protein